MPKAVKEHKGSKLEGANFLVLPPHPLSPRGTRRGKDNKRALRRHSWRCRQPGHPARGARGSPAAELGRRSAGAGRTAGPGRAVPYLEQHKEPEQRQEAAAAARPRGQVPHRGVDGEPGRPVAPPGPRAAHNGELGLQPRPWAPRLPGRAHPAFPVPLRPLPSAFCTGILSGTRARRGCSLTVKDGEGGDWSGREAWRGVRVGSEAGALRAARRGPPAAEVLTLRAADS